MLLGEESRWVLPSPHAVLMQRVQPSARGHAALRARLLVQVLETLSGCQAALRALLGHIQPPAEAQGPCGAVVGKQHRETVVALRQGGDVTGAWPRAGTAPPFYAQGNRGWGQGTTQRGCLARSLVVGLGWSYGEAHASPESQPGPPQVP